MQEAAGGGGTPPQGAEEPQWLGAEGNVTLLTLGIAKKRGSYLRPMMSPGRPDHGCGYDVIHCLAGRLWGQ